MFTYSIIQALLDRFYHGPVKRTDQAFVICCPWHADSSPSCNIFSKSGVFFCWRCHFGKNKGVSPTEGFSALGVPINELERYKQQAELTAIEFQLQPLWGHQEEIDIPTTSLEVRDQVICFEPWPRFWGFRDVHSSTMEDPRVQSRFNPRLVSLNTKLGPERLPRLSLNLANSEGSPSEVFLRLSSEQQPKAVNAKGMNLRRPDLLPLGFDPKLLHATASWPDYLILVEGPYDALKTYEHLILLGMTDRVEVGAILGTGQWGHAWREKFLVSYLPRMKGTLVLGFDADEAGFNLTRQVILDLKMYIPKERLKIFHWRGRAKDPGDLSLSEFKEAWPST